VTAGQLTLAAPVAEEPSRGEIPPLDDTRAAAPRPRCCPTCGHPRDEFASLTDPPAPGSKSRRGDRDTAQAAAKLAWPNAGTTRARLVEAIAAAPDGLTTEEACERTGIKQVTASTRLTEAERGGWVVAAPHTRAGSSGAQATVWLVTERAREKLRETEAMAA
jgi:hypothetical protein